MYQFLEDTAPVAQNLIAIFAFIVSVVAIWYARKSVLQQQQHNELSLKPVLHLNRLDYEDKICVSLVNRGLGPAIITKASFFVSGKSMEVEKFVDLMPNEPGFAPWSDFAGSLVGRAIVANGTNVLIDFSGKRATDNPEQREKIRKALSLIEMDISYEDFYGNSHELRGTLEWFGRHFGG